MKTVLITGAGKGIGRAIALKMLKEGYGVAANYRSSADDIATLREEAVAAGWLTEQDSEQRLLGIQADVAKDADVQLLVKTCYDHFGSIDVLVNNAGMTRDGLLVRMSEQDFDDVLETNAKSVFLLTKHVAKIMMKQRSGRIIICLRCGSGGNAGQMNYSAKSCCHRHDETASRTRF